MCIRDRDNTAQNIANDSVDIVGFNTVVTDNTGLMAVTASNAIDLVRPGNYLIIGSVSTNAFPGASNNSQVRIHIDGTYVRSVLNHVPSGSNWGPQVSHAFIGAAGNRITLRMYQVSGGNVALYVTNPENLLTAQEIAAW